MTLFFVSLVQLQLQLQLQLPPIVCKSNNRMKMKIEISDLGVSFVRVRSIDRTAPKFAKQYVVPVVDTEQTSYVNCHIGCRPMSHTASIPCHIHLR
jgi:hypothetical protein